MTNRYKQFSSTRVNVGPLSAILARYKLRRSLLGYDQPCTAAHRNGVGHGLRSFFYVEIEYPQETPLVRFSL